MTQLTNQIITAIRAAVGAGPVALHEPSFTGNEWLYLKECLDSTFVSSVGKFVDRFEMDLARFTGAKYAVAVVAEHSGPGSRVAAPIASSMFDFLFKKRISNA
jgi:hypothetical protein